MLEAYLFAITGVILAQASPGPNFLAVVGAGLSNGRRIGFFTLLGISTGMILWATLMAIGFGGLLIAFPWLLMLMKILGGGYLLWMAFKALKTSASNDQSMIQKSSSSDNPITAFRNGVLVLMTNPKAALMWAAVASFLFGSGLNSWQVAGFGPLAMVTAFLIYGTYLYIFTTGIALQVYDRFSRWIQAALGVAFGVLGGKLLFDGMKELKQ